MLQEMLRHAQRHLSLGRVGSYPAPCTPGVWRKGSPFATLPRFAVPDCVQKSQRATPAASSSLNVEGSLIAGWERGPGLLLER